MLFRSVDKYKVDTIYNLAALLSAVAENKPQLAWKIGLGGLFNTLEVAREKGCAVFTPSSIGSFGPDTPKDKTPQDTVQRPRTMYGVTKVSGDVMVSPGPNSGCCLPVANASSATLIKSIDSVYYNVNITRNIRRLLVLPEIAKSTAKVAIFFD